MKWRKLGKIFKPDGQTTWMTSHASVPIAIQIDNDHWRFYFSARDRQQRSHTGYIDFDMRTQHILALSQQPVLRPGPPGAFDDSGAMASCILYHDNKLLMYYIGWNLSTPVPFRNSIGLAIGNRINNDLVFTKYSEGPIIDRSIVDPYFTASSSVIHDNGWLKMWYLSCVKWKAQNSGFTHYYHIKYAQSKDGIYWQRNGDVAIDFKDNYEYAISVPRVIKENGIYKMWYSYRASKLSPTYRLGYAESLDGLKWDRLDEDVGIDVSSSGWDAEMICYPFIFDFNGERYLLYNGNGYGRSGFGLAVLKND